MRGEGDVNSLRHALLGLLGELLAGSSGGGGADLLHEHLHGVPPLQNRPHTHHTTRTTTSTGTG